MKTSSNFVVLCTLLIFSFCSQSQQKQVKEEPVRKDKEKPNVVIIFADDLGYGDVGCYGATKIKTPNIDALARQGRRFTDAHSASAVCSPSRYGLMTGRYPLTRNFWGPIPRDTPLTIDLDQLTIAKVMKEAGYATACIGKWHLGFGAGEKTDWNAPLKPGPLEVGFDYYYGIPQVNSGPPFIYVENHAVVGYDPQDPFVLGEQSVTQEWPAKGWRSKFGGAKKAHTLYKDEEIGKNLKNRAIKWMKEQNTEDPFFLYLATTNIHHPFTPAPQFKGTSECGLYGDFVHELDWIVGEVTSALEEMGVADNTLIVFTSDNGGMLNNGGQDAWAAGHKLNGELLGFKFGAWEGGHRIPFIAKWPGKIPANTVSDQLISQVDLLSTLSQVVERPLSSEESPNSVGVLEALTGNPKEMIRDHLLISPNSSSHLVIRKNEWVYIDAQDEGGFRQKNIGDHAFGGAAVFKLTNQKNSDVENAQIREDAPPAQLYNLAVDLSQTSNVYMENPKVVEEMKILLESYRKKTGDFKSLGWIDTR